MINVRSDLDLMAGYHSPQVEVEVRLNTNESPTAPSQRWRKALIEAIADIEPNRYPDRQATVLREKLATLHGVKAENIFCANGSNEVIQTLLLAYGGDGRKALIFEPTYALHSHIAKLTNTTVVTSQRADDFTIPLSSLVAAKDADITFLCSPNNPTGIIDTPEVLSTALKNTKGLVVLDEAYGQFASRSGIDHVNDETPLVVLRTFSKTWAMAGVRLGYLVGPSWLVEQLWKVALPYHLSALTQAAGIAALDFDDEMPSRIQMLISERQRISEQLSKLPVTLWPSESNFILFRPNAIAGSEIWQRLLDKSVLIRNCNSWPRLQNCLRVTVGTPEENDRFLLAIEEALS